jgi:hypothetical protein
MIGLYFETWSSPWTAIAQNMDLAIVSDVYPGVNVVYLAFASPDSSYSLGQRTWTNTGLDFSQDFVVVQQAIQILRSKGVIVMLSVGGGSYWSEKKNFNAQGVENLRKDLGCDGIDIDWEVGTNDDVSLTACVKALKFIGCPKLSIAAFSTGAFGKDANSGDPYKGMDIDALVNCGGQIDWVNIMSYDAGSQFDPLGAFTCYRIYYKGPLLLGFEPGKQSWGDKVIQMKDVDDMCNWVKADGDKNGVFIWSNRKDTSGSPSLSAIVAEANKILSPETPAKSNPPPSVIPPTPSSKCPNCGIGLKISLA